MTRPGRAISPPAAKSNREPRDTAAGCRDHAAVALQMLATTPDGFMRRRLERSAAAWTARAERLALDEAEYAKWLTAGR